MRPVNAPPISARKKEKEMLIMINKRWAFVSSSCMVMCAAFKLWMTEIKEVSAVIERCGRSGSRSGDKKWKGFRVDLKTDKIKFRLKQRCDGKAWHLLLSAGVITGM